LHYPLINRLLAYKIQQETEIYMEASAANEEVTQQTIKTLDKIYQVRELLLDNLKNQPKLEEIARQVGLNRNKLNEEFKVLFGNTIFVWLREQRLQKARKLLCDQATPIQVIAEAVGCTSQAQFSRLFKQRFGQSHSEYRLTRKIDT
jgi:AraC-like DNA-binding protein